MIHSSTSRNHNSDVSAYILPIGSPSLGIPDGHIHQHASFQEQAAKLHSHIAQERETDKYFQTAAHLSISLLNCCPFAHVTKTEQKCTEIKKRRKTSKEKNRSIWLLEWTTHSVPGLTQQWKRCKERCVLRMEVC